MTTELAVAGLTLIGVIAYALFAGADFGGGIWDLVASGPRREQQRRAIARAMAPVWEANHVWLIFVIVLVFSCFPTAFAALTIGFFKPFHLALLGITLRGVAFVFRAYGPPEQASRWGAIFGASSVGTPFVLGAVLGSVSYGRFPDCLAPFPLATGAIALALCAYLASVYLAWEADGEPELQEDWRRRALVVGGVVVASSAIALPLAYIEAPRFFGALLHVRVLPILLVGGAVALVSGWAILRRRFALARWTAAAHVALLLLGWGAAQYPYIVYPDYTLPSLTDARGTARFVLVSLPFGAAILGPSLFLLFRVFKRKRGL